MTRPGLDPSRRGYHVLYRPHETNRCPGCGRCHWHLGRSSAECGFCATALPLARAALVSPLALAWQ